MAYLLFSGYLLLLLLLLPQIGFFKKSSISGPYLQALFSLKAAAGILYGKLHQGMGGDTWEYHQDGLAQLALLYKDPGLFFYSIVSPPSENGYGAFFGIRDSWWNNLDWIIITKTLAFFDILSGSNYYINSLFFNLFSFTGTVLLLRTWRIAAPDKDILIQFLPFLIPSFIFWSSGIHKESLLVLALGLVVHALFAYPGSNSKIPRRLLQLLAGLGLMLLLRNFLLLPAATALLSLFFLKRLHLSPVVGLGASLLLWFILFFGMSRLSSKGDAGRILYERREAFLKKQGSSRVEAVKLKPTLSSFIRNAPAAFVIGLFRPLPGDVHNAASGFAAAESVFLLLLTAMALYRLRQPAWNQPLLQFCLYFTIPLFMIIGYTIPFLGAVVRYRSIVLPLWIIALLMMALNKQGGIKVKEDSNNVPRIGL